MRVPGPQWRNTMQTDAPIARGLEGVVSHATRLSEVDGENGRLVVGGYDIHELVGRASFEEVAHLLWHGELPTDAQQRGLRTAMAKARHLPAPIMAVLAGPARAASGMHALRMAA